MNKFFSQAVIKGEQGGLQTKVEQEGKDYHPEFYFSKWVEWGGEREGLSLMRKGCRFSFGDG